MAEVTNKSVVPGRYRHYKGGEYEVYEVGTHSETEELLVAYRPLYGESALWLRPLAMFLEVVEIEGKVQPRFELISPADGASL